MRLQKFLLVLNTLILCGCPPKTFGFYRSANPTMTVVGFECVENGVAAIPGVTDLTYGTEKGGRPLTWSGIKPATTFHRYKFEYQAERLDFWLDQYWDGKVSYHGGAATTEKERAPKLVEMAQPLYSKIEVVIQDCGFDNLDEVAFGRSF